MPLFDLPDVLKNNQGRSVAFMRAIFLAVGFVVSLVPPCVAGVTVSSPGNGVTVQSPVHFVASSTTACSKGVSAMGIYTAPSVLAYVVQGAKLDTNLALAAGTYQAVVQPGGETRGGANNPNHLHFIYKKD